MPDSGLPRPLRAPNRASGIASGSSPLCPAASLDLPRLTEIYNRSRDDYLIPMPMSVGRLRAYVNNYDIDLEQSLVAHSAGRPVGLAMLGLRDDRAWISRLGVLPEARKAGLGRIMVAQLIENARAAGCQSVVIEVIEDNAPARALFAGFGFKETRQLLVTRRPPRPIDILDHGASVRILGYHEAMGLLDRRRDLPSWVTESRSMARAGNISAIEARWDDGRWGWLAYGSSAWLLSRILIGTEAGEPSRIGRALLQQLHWRHPLQDAVCENISAHDAHWPAMQAMDYMISFVRVEMRLDLGEA
jgi:ribosomal protein S18 acetylase RimI-like enzyme